jgi:hypothetical protein
MIVRKSVFSVPRISSNGSISGLRSEWSRSAQEREYWHSHVVDLIAAERERLVALIEEALRKVIDEFTADHKFNRLIAKVTESVDRVFDRLEAQLDQYAISGMCRPDDDSQPPPSTH